MSLFKGASIGQTLVLEKGRYSRSLREAKRELRGWEKDVERGSRNVRKALATVGKVAAVAIAAGFAVAIHEGVQELNDMQQASAQTASAIKAQGKAAFVTQKYVEGLAGAMLKKTGIDDQAIQKGENLILTMARLDNSTGAARINFKKATQVMADLSVRMGTDTASSAKILSKALADPEKAGGKLSRVIGGLTKAQEAQIAAAVKANDTAKAQGLILKFVGDKVKGAAAAYGKTAAGQIAKAREEFAGLSAELVQAALPAFLKTLHAAEDGIHALQGWAKTDDGRRALENIGDAASTAGSALQALAGVLVSVGGFMAQHSSAVIAATAAVVGYAGAVKAAGAVSILMAKINLMQVSWQTFKAATEGATLAQWAFNRAIMANPVGLIATGVAAAVGAMVYFAQKESDIERQSRQTEDAIRGVSDAITAMGDTALAFDESKLQLKMARVALADAERKLAGTTKGTRAYRDAELQLEQAQLGVRRAQDNVTKSRKAHTDAVDKGAKKLGDMRREIADEAKLQKDLAGKIEIASRAVKAGGRVGATAAAQTKKWKDQLQASRDRSRELESNLKTLTPAVQKMGGEASTASGKVASLATKIQNTASNAADAARDVARMFQAASSGGGGRGPRRQQRGGMVPGSGSGDKIPALLEPGEGIINRRAVKAMGGPAAIMAINAATPRFKTGGVAGLAASAVASAQIRADRPIWYLEKLIASDQRQLRRLIADRPRRAHELAKLRQQIRRAKKGPGRDRLQARADAIRSWLAEYGNRRDQLADEIVSLRQEVKDKRAELADAANGGDAGIGADGDTVDAGGLTLADALAQINATLQALNGMIGSEGGNVRRIVLQGDVNNHFAGQPDPTHWREALQFNLAGVAGGLT